MLVFDVLYKNHPPSLLGGYIQCTYIAMTGVLSMMVDWISQDKGLEPIVLLLLLHSPYNIFALFVCVDM